MSSTRTNDLAIVEKQILDSIFCLKNKLNWTWLLQKDKASIFEYSKFVIADSVQPFMRTSEIIQRTTGLMYKIADCIKWDTELAKNGEYKDFDELDRTTTDIFAALSTNDEQKANILFSLLILKTYAYVDPVQITNELYNRRDEHNFFPCTILTVLDNIQEHGYTLHKIANIIRRFKQHEYIEAKALPTRNETAIALTRQHTLIMLEKNSTVPKGELRQQLLRLAQSMGFTASMATFDECVKEHDTTKKQVAASAGQEEASIQAGNTQLIEYYRAKAEEELGSTNKKRLYAVVYKAEGKGNEEIKKLLNHSNPNTLKRQGLDLAKERGYLNIEHLMPK